MLFFKFCIKPEIETCTFLIDVQKMLKLIVMKSFMADKNIKLIDNVIPY